MLFWHLLGRENAHIRPSMLRFCRLRPASTDAAEREQRGLAHYAEPRGGNEDSLLVIMNFELPKKNGGGNLTTVPALRTLNL